MHLHIIKSHIDFKLLHLIVEYCDTLQWTLIGAELLRYQMGKRYPSTTVFN